MVRLLSLLALFAVAAPLRADEPVVVVSLGDSITKGVRSGVKEDETFAALVAKELGVKVVNVGVGGERTDGALARLDKAVLALTPRIVLVMYGTNDSYVDKDKSDSRLSVEQYRKNLEALVGKLRAANAEPVLMTEPRWGLGAKNGVGEDPNVRLVKYVEACREVAREKKLRLVDHFAHWTNAEAKGTKLAEWTTDLCHPNPRGHRELADLISPVLREALKPVSPCEESAAAETIAETFEYASSVDGTKPLKADVAYLADGKPKPLLVVMHGYSGGRKAVTLDTRELAAHGVFAVAPDMRGSGDSGGKWDSGGLDVHDIADAVLAAVKKYPKEIDAGNLNIVGYSGGGGNAIACMVRFPDLFRTYVSFFGISDYAGWHESRGRPDCNAMMEKALGGPPRKLPDLYLSRNAIPAAGNARVGKLHFFWDETETQCPADMVEDFVAEYRSAGLKQAVEHVSKKTDAVRWTHAYRSANRQLAKADPIFLQDVKVEGAKSNRLPPTGKLVVPGYVVTRHFQVWVGNGTAGQVTIEYDLRGDKPVVKVVENAKDHTVRIELASPFAELP